MPARHVVVDGSNIATEGRSLPSLVQLDVAVREYRREFPEDVITVVVDATFGHRIDPSERADFDEAVAHNEIVSPPAGAIGRGDAFLLRVAEKVGATVLSNDSFQEFHGEHEWLFNNGRLIGGKPVPGVGWIFTPRTPVRGPKSRDSMREARRVKPGPRDEIKKVQKAIAVATEEAVEPDSPKVKRRRRGRGGAPPAEPVNDPLPFIEFVAAHPLGGPVDAEVESFSSHGAFVTADGLRCYIPLTGLGDPAPRAAKEVLKRGETRQFVLQALDPPRRGIELALPEFAHVSGVPTAETVEEEIKESARRPSRRKRGGRGRGGDEADVVAGDGAVAVVPTDVVVALAEAADDAVPRSKAKDKAKKSSRGRKAAPGAAPEVAPATAIGAVEADAAPAPARGGRTRGASKRAAASRAGDAAPAAASPAAAAPPAAVEPAPAGGPRKRPARPRAGAARLQPSQAPVPLAPAAPAPAETPSTAPAPARKRAPRKAAAPPAAVDAPADIAAVPPARPSRKRAAAVSPAPKPVAIGAPAPARRAGRKAAAATSEPAPAAPAKAVAPTRKAPAKKAAKAAAGEPPAAPSATRAAAKKAAATKAAIKKAPAKKAPAKKAPAKKAPATTKARKRSADLG